MADPMSLQVKVGLFIAVVGLVSLFVAFIYMILALVAYKRRGAAFKLFFGGFVLLVLAMMTMDTNGPR